MQRVTTSPTINHTTNPTAAAPAAARLSVVGTGYLGATHAAAMAELGHTVVGIDTDATKVAALADGTAPFYEPGLNDLLRRNIAAGRLRFTTDFAAAADVDVHFICVGTPQRKGSDAADTSYVDAAVNEVLRHAPTGSTLVGKSTVPVGTAARLAGVIRDTRGTDVDLVWNPEFLREGFAVEDTLRPDRIVIGTSSSERNADALLAVYTPQLANNTPLIVTDYATAELVKVAANSFLATKISFINAMSDICDASGADVTTLATAIGLDDRIGPKFLRAGVGFGGGCLPKDIRAFMARANELGVGESFLFLREVDRINMVRRSGTITRAQQMLNGTVLGANVAVLGVAFKPDSDDIRDSPALNIAAGLHLHGATVNVYDPKGMDNAAKAFPTLHYTPTLKDALTDADLVLLLTEWDEFVCLDPAETGQLVRHRRIIDGRNVLDAAAWTAAGWQYQGLGRS